MSKLNDVNVITSDWANIDLSNSNERIGNGFLRYLNKYPLVIGSKIYCDGLYVATFINYLFVAIISCKLK